MELNQAGHFESKIIFNRHLIIEMKEIVEFRVELSDTNNNKNKPDQI